ncbi:hypothetical protein [Aureimonas jatrophae]|uniref:hypothetical protein n=1 Tax=Aureimonas jatrophae TaxID=1166073 RepID=UPI000B882DDB|nr:hypothetical protein [Aureimonas jatrophae]MBB3952656.1 hypothetical protein [Aureimonas jatrophae]
MLFASAMILVAVSMYAAAASVAARGWTGDAASWIQAAGSIAAIVGAAWIARSEAARARRDRRRQYEEAAGHVRFVIAQAQFESQIVAADLVNRSVAITPADVRDWRMRMLTSSSSLAAFAARTDHIHPMVSHVIANARVLTDDMLARLEEVASLVDGGGQPDEDMKGSLVGPHHALAELLQLYDRRMEGIQNALDQSGGSLPISSWRN